MIMIFFVFIVLRYLWDMATAKNPRQVSFKDPETIHPSVLRQIHDGT